MAKFHIPKAQSPNDGLTREDDDINYTSTTENVFVCTVDSPRAFYWPRNQASNGKTKKYVVGVVVPVVLVRVDQQGTKEY